MARPEVIRPSSRGADRLEAAGGVAVQHLALVQPAHRLQAHVRVRRHLHTRLVGDVVGAVVVDEAPGADHAPAQVRQQPAYLRGLAELDAPRAEEFAHGFRHHEAAAAAQGGNRLAIKIAHDAQPRPVRRFPSVVPPGPATVVSRVVSRAARIRSEISSHGHSSHVLYRA